MSSIKDVARLAHVSVSTVSNILNNRNNYSIEVYNRVMAAMDELNYSPNMLARNLRANKLLFIGVILPDLSGHYQKIYEGINQMAGQFGYYLILKLSRHNRQLEQTYLEELITLSVRGILLVTCQEDNTAFFDHILARSIPIIFLERCIAQKDYTCIRFEHEMLLTQLTNDLLNKNPASQIMLITGPSVFSSEREAADGFLTAYRNRQIEPSPENIVQVALPKEYAFRDIMNVLKKCAALPDAYLVTNEVVGFSLLEILALYHSEAQVCLLSGDDWHRLRLPPNTMMVRQKAIEMGLLAVELLHQYMHAPLLFENRLITLPPDACTATASPAITARRHGAVNILFLEGPTADALISLIPNFTKNTALDVRWQQCRYTDLYDTILEDFNRSESQYDIYMIDLPWVSQLIEKNCLANLKDFMPGHEENFLANYSPLIMSQSFNQNGHFYTAPIMIGFQILLYRKDLFEDPGLRWQFYETYGIPLQPPKNWTEFNLIARFFTRSLNPHSPVDYGTCIAGQHHVTIMQEFLPRQWAFNGKSVLDSGEVVIDSIQNVKTLQNLKESYACSPPESLGFFWDDQIHLFFQGKVAMINTFNSHILRTTDAAWNEFVNQIGYDDIPGNIPMLGGWVLGINRRSRSAGQAFRFIQWACSDRLAVHNTLLGGLVPKTCVIENKELMLSYPWFGRMQKAPEKGRIGDLVRKHDGSLVDCFDLDKIMGESIIDVLLERRTIPDALKTIGQDIQKLL